MVLRVLRGRQLAKITLFQFKILIKLLLHQTVRKYERIAYVIVWQVLLHGRLDNASSRDKNVTFKVTVNMMLPVWPPAELNVFQCRVLLTTNNAAALRLSDRLLNELKRTTQLKTVKQYCNLSCRIYWAFHGWISSVGCCMSRRLEPNQQYWLPDKAAIKAT